MVLYYYCSYAGGGLPRIEYPENNTVDYGKCLIGFRV